MLTLDCIEVVDIAAGDGKWQDSNRHNLQLFAYRVDRGHFFRSEVAHNCAAIGNSLDDPLFLEFEKSEPDVGAVGVELLAEILLDQAFTWVTPAQDDVLF